MEKDWLKCVLRKVKKINFKKHIRSTFLKTTEIFKKKIISGTISKNWSRILENPKCKIGKASRKNKYYSRFFLEIMYKLKNLDFSWKFYTESQNSDFFLIFCQTYIHITPVFLIPIVSTIVWSWNRRVIAFVFQRRHWSHAACRRWDATAWRLFCNISKFNQHNFFKTSNFYKKSTKQKFEGIFRTF